MRIGSEGASAGAPSVALVSGCDKRYFPLLVDLVQSIVRFGNSSRIKLAFFDIDFSTKQKEWLRQYTDIIVYPDFDIQVPDEWKVDRRGLTATIRPFIPKYFPGFDIYIYADVDTWVQDWRAIELYIEGAREKAITVVPQVDRSYRHGPEARDFRYQTALESFGSSTADELMLRSQINSGIFALAKDAPHWEAWARHLQRAVRNRGKWFGSAQAALNYIIYMERLPSHFLPAICNWQCHLARPMWDEKRKLFCEPFLPYQEIYFMHLTAITKARQFKIRTVHGDTLESGLRYHDIRDLLQ